MKYRTRIYYTEEQKALMWDRWQKGDSLHAIAGLFDRHHSAFPQPRSKANTPPTKRLCGFCACLRSLASTCIFIAVSYHFQNRLP